MLTLLSQKRSWKILILSSLWSYLIPFCELWPIYFGGLLKRLPLLLTFRDIKNGIAEKNELNHCIEGWWKPQFLLNKNAGTKRQICQPLSFSSLTLCSKIQNVLFIWFIEIEKHRKYFIFSRNRTLPYVTENDFTSGRLYATNSSM